MEHKTVHIFINILLILEIHEGTLISHICLLLHQKFDCHYK